jgi:DNA-binding CsgD family transcriptional regulator
MSNSTEVVAPSGTGTRPVLTVASIEVQWDADGDVGRTLPQSALSRVQGAVRAEDRVCPVTANRLVVEFGPVANSVPPQVLGYRLAQALGRDLPSDTRSTSLAVSVGMATPAGYSRAADVTRRALAASSAGSSQLTRRPFAGTQPSNALITVDGFVVRPISPTVPHRTAVHRRSVYRYRVGRSTTVLSALVPTRAATDRSPVGDLNGHGTGVDPTTVLVVDPAADRPDEPGFATITAASMAERLGCRSAAVTASLDGVPPLAIDGFALDLVVLVLEGGWSGLSSTWSTGAWGIPASLTAIYRAAGLPVLAVSAGAGAGAVASCVAQGALALFGLEHLPEALESLAIQSGDDQAPGPEVPFPPHFKALVNLTASERRILYFLTEGWAAQDIADQLVVSLTTVRSHIRSTLRKLGVRSQLAAVAIANSRDFDHALSGDAS